MKNSESDSLLIALWVMPFIGFTLVMFLAWWCEKCDEKAEATRRAKEAMDEAVRAASKLC